MVDGVPPLPHQTLKVSDLTRYMKYLMERDEFLSSLSVEGEISDLSRSPSGHIYFTLKDASSQVACVLFRREVLRQQEEARKLQRGMSVIVHGFMTVYEPRGTYQVFVERVLAQGEGAFALRFAQLKNRLEVEGLFANERKRTLPEFPRALALITSPGSQAYHDVLHRLRTQYPFVRVIEVGVSVQGEGAADEVAMAVDIVNRLTDAEAILIVRGGGAPEELAAFNDERLARAIFASRVPVVTGIGHETDYTIADFVADQRAATPSLAAATAVPDLAGLVRQIRQRHEQAGQAIRNRVHLERRRFHDANRGFLRSSPQGRVRTRRLRVDDLHRAMQRAMMLHLRQKREHITSLRAQLAALDPLAILGRGYSVLTDEKTGAVVSKLEQAPRGSRLVATVSDGQFAARVEER